MNPQCKNTPALLLQWHDGDLAADQVEVLESHILECAQCRKQREQLLLVERELTDYGESVTQCPSLLQQRPRRAAWMFAAAVLAAAVLVIWIPRPQNPPAKSPSAPAVAEGSFVPIPYVPPLEPYESSRVVHMDVSVAALVAAGYRVQLTSPAAVVPADLLVGEDGRVHGVRLDADGILN